MYFSCAGARDTPSPRSTTANSPDPASTGDQDQDQGTTSHSTTTNPLSPSDNNTIINNQGTSTAIPTTPTEDLVATTSHIKTLDIVPYAIGGALVGLAVAIVFVLVLVLTVAFLVRRNKHKLDLAKSREARIVKAQKFSTAYVKMKANDSYIPIFREISTKDNIAYGKVGNNSRDETIDPSKVNMNSVEYDYIKN